jgi:cytochrome c553
MNPPGRHRAARLSVAALVYTCAMPAAVASGVNAAELAAVCASCHGPSGASGIPSLVEQGAGQIEALMLAYRAGARDSQIMTVIANALSPDEIAAIARALASQPR